MPASRNRWVHWSRGRRGAKRIRIEVKRRRGGSPKAILRVKSCDARPPLQAAPSHSPPQGPAGGERCPSLGAAEGVLVQRALVCARFKILVGRGGFYRCPRSQPGSNPRHRLRGRWAAPAAPPPFPSFHI